MERRPQRDVERSADDVWRQRHPLEDGAVGASKFPASRDETSRRYDVGDAKVLQRRHRVRRKRQTEAELPRRCGALEHADVPAGLSQGDRRRKAADPGADDECGARQATD